MTVKGWCPGAHRPMMSGDGLIVRVRPYFGRLEARQAIGLCDAARTYGSGVIDLTNRGNLQIRGVSQDGHAPLLAALDGLGVLDAAPQIETRRNIIVEPFWTPGDSTHRITSDVLRILPQLPELPAKFGFAVDTGGLAVLRAASADIRIERSGGMVMVRADGAERGQRVAVSDAAEAALALAQWFARHRQPDDRRMAAVVQRIGAPEGHEALGQPDAPAPVVGTTRFGMMVGAAFGHISATALTRVITTTGATAVRLTPWRMVIFEGAEAVDDPGFICTPETALLNTHACPGAPHCASATVETRMIARALAGQVGGSLHVSGCAKGCACKPRTDITLIGRDGRFDLVRGGHAWDAPDRCGLDPATIATELTRS
ncbi:cobalamin biosynthesis protein CobG [Roseobacter sp.]|uniref:cobalamin biosynthesis protein CobG n=1 Tax=Roseobacter sp. TaxID=1907202 RepID=UPI003299C278